MYESVFQRLLFPLFEGIKGRSTAKYIVEYREQQYWPYEDILALQEKKLKKLIEYSYQFVPYYRKLWRKLGLTPKDFQTINDLERLPVLTKQIIKENYAELISEEYKNNHLTKTTGGSTGIPLSLAYTQESYSRRNAVMWRGYSWAKLPPGRKALYFWGTSIGSGNQILNFKESLYNRFYNRYLISCFNLDASRFKKIVKQINQIKPEVIVSYVNPIYALACWVNDNNIRIHNPLSIITGAEPLYEYQREAIEKAFKTDVFNTYGCREVMLIASECQHKKGLHMNIDHLVIESLDVDQKNILGQLGELAITDLHNYAMPFIRYKNEDLISISHRSCSCSINLPLMDLVEGRVLDCIKTSDGKILPGEFFPHFLKDFKGIEKFQVVQNDITSLEINLVANDELNASDLKRIEHEVITALGKNIRLDIKIVSNIPLTKSGKHRVTISNI